MADIDPVTLQVMLGALRAACEEMGVVLVRSAHSANIKERRDASTALFDARGQMVMQADELIGFAASRAHHADVGGSVPGSMPADSTTLEDEGVVIPPTKLVSGGEVDRRVLDDLTGRMRGPRQRVADL